MILLLPDAQQILDLRNSKLAERKIMFGTVADHARQPTRRAVAVNSFRLSQVNRRFLGSEGVVRLGPLAAASLVATLPSLVFFTVIQRHLRSGLLAGGVKG